MKTGDEAFDKEIDAELRSVMEDGVRIGLGLCIKEIDRHAARRNVTAAQRSVLRDVAAAIRQVSAEYKLEPQDAE